MDAELLRGLVDQLKRGYSLTLADAERIEAAFSVAQGQRFVMVPRVPTEAMRATFRAEKDSGTFFTHTTLQCADFDSRYAAMLAAAPAQPDGVGK